IANLGIGALEDTVDLIFMSDEELKISIPSESNDHDRIKIYKESIDYIGNTYVVTYSKEHKSILGWSIDNIENDGHGQQQPDEFYELDK
ncbi:46547_t:CDS:2, partial [Gigaspora margarita]